MSVSCPGRFEDQESEFEEATGNAGASFERFYQCAALVLWPRNRQLAVIAMEGLRTSMPRLSRLIAEWEQAGAKSDDSRQREALILASGIQKHWPGTELDREPLLRLAD